MQSVRSLEFGGNHMVKNSFGTDFLKNLFRSDFERLEMHITVLIRIIANDLQVIDGEGFLLLAL